MQIFHDLRKGDLPIFSLNFGVITLLPKTPEANKIQQYRPICLLNVSFKIFTKVATIRINSVADHLVSPTQTAFMRDVTSLKGWLSYMKPFTSFAAKTRVGLSSK